MLLQLHIGLENKWQTFIGRGITYLQIGDDIKKKKFKAMSDTLHKNYQINPFHTAALVIYP